MARHKNAQRRPPGQKKPPLTHFLCLPLVTPASKRQLETSLKRFREDVSSSSDTDETAISPVHPNAIRPVGTLHCTLGVMSLEENELTKAVEFLNSVDIGSILRGNTSERAVSSNVAKQAEPPSPTTPLTVNLTGLASMHAPQTTSILYIAPEDLSGRLFPFCTALQRQFKNERFLVEDKRDLKLHATVVNTIYAKGRKLAWRPGAVQQNAESSSAIVPDRSQGHGPKANAPLKIDATAILERYKTFVWAEDVVLDRVAICEMGAKKITDTQGNVTGEEYTEVASIPLTG